MVTGYSIGPYKLGSTLGVGTFGKVKLAVHEGTSLKVAVKIVNKAKMLSMDMHEKIRREIAILQCLHHPHVIRLYELIDSPTDIFMVMEYVPGGELFDYIVQHSRLQEPEARKFFQQILSGVEYCHHHAVCHRDLKPENVLLDSNFNVKVGDFGLSNFMRDGDFLRTSCGSPNYASPEVVSGKPYSGPEVDVWSCAVILYALLCGSLPFDDEHVPNLFKKIKHGNFTLPGHLSEQSRSLIVRMLTVDPVKRITFKEIRRHPWFRVNLPPYLSSSTCLRASIAVTIDTAIIEEMEALGYKVDPDTLDIFPKPGSFPSRATVAYQLLADKKGNQKNPFGRNNSARVIPPPFSFNREVQKRAAAASILVGFDATPLSWTSDYSFGPTQSCSTISQTSESATNYSFWGPPTFRPSSVAGPVAPQCAAPGTYMDWSPGTPICTSSRWKLGIESSLDSPIIVTAILNTLKALNYEWNLVTPFKIRCRAIGHSKSRRSQSEKKYLPLNGSFVSVGKDFNVNGLNAFSTSDGKSGRYLEDNTISTPPDYLASPSVAGSTLNLETSDCLEDSQRSIQQRDNNISHVIICIQLYKISAARYLIDVQLFDGPTLVSMSESLWLTSAIYSALTQIQLQDCPGSALPTWSPSTPIFLGAGPLIGPQQRLFC